MSFCGCRIAHRWPQSHDIRFATALCRHRRPYVLNGCGFHGVCSRYNCRVNAAHSRTFQISTNVKTALFIRPRLLLHTMLVVLVKIECSSRLGETSPNETTIKVREYRTEQAGSVCSGPSVVRSRTAAENGENE